MLEQKIDLWSTKNGAICITTNGTIKKNGEAVMGRGCALEATKKHPGIQKILGSRLQDKGNHVHKFIGMGFPYPLLITFPVKHNWWEKADIKLIEQSCHELVQLIGQSLIVYLPRPGCGNGGLNWEKEVKPILEKILPDNIIVVSNK